MKSHKKLIAAFGDDSKETRNPELNGQNEGNLKETQKFVKKLEIQINIIKKIINPEQTCLRQKITDYTTENETP